MFWDLQNSDFSDCTVQRLRTEQHNRHITRGMAAIFLHYQFYSNNLRLLMVIVTYAITRHM